MINRIYVDNFKSLKKIDIPLKRLNILAGLNGMGKSSLIQIFLLLRQSNLINTNKLELKGSLVDIGKGKDALYQFAEQETITFMFESDETSQLFYDFQWEAESNSLSLTHKIPPGPNIQKLIYNLQYISADRLGPTILYDMSQNSLDDGILGTHGQYTFHFLAVNGNRFKVNPKRFHKKVSEHFLMQQVNAWLGEISPGVKVNATEVPGIDKIQLTYEFTLGKGRTQFFKPTNVGFGITYALSVIVALLIAGEDQIVIIENPEAHIHPHGQAELGELMALVAASGTQLIVETHSDHIVNGIRVATKDKVIPCDDVQITWFHKITTETEQYTNIITIQLDENGELNEYPEGFLEEWNNQLLKLV